DVLILEQSLPAKRSLKPGQRPKQRRFSGTVPSKHTDEAAGRDSHLEVGEHGAAWGTIAHRKIVESKHQRCPRIVGEKMRSAMTTGAPTRASTAFKCRKCCSQGAWTTRSAANASKAPPSAASGSSGRIRAVPAIARAK